MARTRPAILWHSIYSYDIQYNCMTLSATLWNSLLHYDEHCISVTFLQPLQQYDTHSSTVALLEICYTSCNIMALVEIPRPLQHSLWLLQHWHFLKYHGSEVPNTLTTYNNLCCHFCSICQLLHRNVNTELCESSLCNDKSIGYFYYHGADNYWQFLLYTPTTTYKILHSSFTEKHSHRHTSKHATMPTILL